MVERVHTLQSEVKDMQMKVKEAARLEQIVADSKKELLSIKEQLKVHASVTREILSHGFRPEYCTQSPNCR
jgi:hypothetical protein